MTSIGETLRRERLRRNLDLERISQELKISSRLLEAIEDDRFDKLPGGVFAKSFVRQYARLLSLDEDEMISDLQLQLAPSPVPQASEFKPEASVSLPRVKAWNAVSDHKSRWTASLPALAMVIVVMLVCSAVYSWWQRSRRPVSAREIAAVPAKTVPAPAPPQAETPKPAITAQSPSPTPVAPPQESTAERQATPAEPASNAAVHVLLTAADQVWVSARTDGKYSFSGTLEPSESRTVEANSTVLLRLGNAGGVSISLNGKPIGPVGPKGQVRTVQLTSGGFQIVPPEAPKPASPEADLDRL
ncbi:MAG: hypothetical protein C5B51_17690 [Terriglobia bacterium]|nr:MAG: hypothetical protein C5B51_17690 [Terriglobia bacterium]